MVALRGEPCPSARQVSVPPSLPALVLPLGRSLFWRAELSAAWCGALTPAHGGNKRNRVGEAAQNAGPLNCCAWHAWGVARSDSHIQCRHQKDGLQPCEQWCTALPEKLGL